MQDSKKETRGHGKVQFNQNLNFIRSELSQGKNATQIHGELKKQGKLTIDVSVFLRYVRELRKSFEVSVVKPISPATVHPPCPPSSPQITESASKTGSRSNAAPSSTPRVFNPQPADLDDQFGIIDASASGSEVDHE